MTDTVPCPRCGDPMNPKYPASTRTEQDDVIGDICSACGHDEAMIELNPLPTRDEWPVKRRFEERA